MSLRVATSIMEAIIEAAVMLDAQHHRRDRGFRPEENYVKIIFMNIKEMNNGKISHLRQAHFPWATMQCH